MVMDEKKNIPGISSTSAVKHSVTIDRRNLVTVTGVLDVISFDENTIIAETQMGVLLIHGENLHVNRLQLDNGDLSVDGQVDSINYEENSGFGKGKSSFLSKLFK